MGLCEDDSLRRYSQEEVGGGGECRAGRRKPGQVRFHGEGPLGLTREPWGGYHTAEFVLRKAGVGCRGTLAPGALPGPKGHHLETPGAQHTAVGGIGLERLAGAVRNNVSRTTWQLRGQGPMFNGNRNHYRCSHHFWKG